jgi:F420-non-reducing hydrogenase iron-sulfur subunit
MSEWQPKIVVFLCQWALKSDSEWTKRFELPQHVRVIEVPCSGRLNPLLLLSTLQHGADGLLVIGCEPGHCHYKEGNYLARRKFATLASFLQHLGLEEGRVHFAWLAETESGRFSGLVEGILTDVQRLGPLQELARREAALCEVPV